MIAVYKLQHVMYATPTICLVQSVEEINSICDMVNMRIQMEMKMKVILREEASRLAPGMMSLLFCVIGR